MFWQLRPLGHPNTLIIFWYNDFLTTKIHYFFFFTLLYLTGVGEVGLP